MQECIQKNPNRSDCSLRAETLKTAAFLVDVAPLFEIAFDTRAITLVKITVISTLKQIEMSMKGTVP